MADVNEKMRDALVAYRYVQRKMLEKWSEGDERVKAGLWAALHKCEALADAALAEQPAQGEAVAWRWAKRGGGYVLTDDKARADDVATGPTEVEALYTAPPAPSVPDALRESYGCNPSYINGWNACRDAMLASGGKASVPEGWKLVPVEITKEMWMKCPPGGTPEHLWNCLLAAAPKAPK